MFDFQRTNRIETAQLERVLKRGVEHVLKRGVQNDLKLKQSTEAAKSKVATSEAIQTEVQK